jgi:hypothetical protein
VLSFGAIRHVDPTEWERWRAILKKYEKLDLIEFMLWTYPVSVDSVGLG